MTHPIPFRRLAKFILLAGLVFSLNTLGIPSSPVSAQEPSATPSATTTETETPSQTPSPTATHTPTASATATSGPSNTATETASPSNTPSATTSSTPTSTQSATSTKPIASYPPQSVLINEIAWAGTFASAFDEWIELHNPGPAPIDLSGWTLLIGPSRVVSLQRTIPAYGYYLMERTDDTSISDIPADLVYTGGLNNSGETLWLRDPNGNTVDSADFSGGWPAGEATSRTSMERIGKANLPGNWGTFTGFNGNGYDAAGNPIPGTPRQPNSFFSSTPTATPTATTSPLTPFPPRAVLISEVAWSGTKASSSDEWIELHNPGPGTIDLTDWTLSDDGDINMVLVGSIPAYSFYLLERTDDTTVADIPADHIYTGSLRNSGETLRLEDPTGNVVDTANSDGGGWPAGDADPRASMERRVGIDLPSNWGTYTGYYGVGRDVSGNRIPGTPRNTNSLFFPTPIPTWIPGRVVINEVLVRPNYDWEGDGEEDTNDEFIELYNIGPSPVNLKGWFLDDVAGGGSRPFKLPSIILRPGKYVVFFHSRTRIALNDSGDDVRLLAPDEGVVDKIHYLKVRAYNLSYGRLPNGTRHMSYSLWPTPGKPNVLFLELQPEELPLTSAIPFIGSKPILRLTRLGRHTALVYRLYALGHVFFTLE